METRGKYLLLEFKKSAHQPTADPDPILLISNNMRGWFGQAMYKKYGRNFGDVAWQFYFEILILWQDRSNPAPRIYVEANEE